MSQYFPVLLRCISKFIIPISPPNEGKWTPNAGFITTMYGSNYSLVLVENNQEWYYLSISLNTQGHFDTKIATILMKKCEGTNFSEFSNKESKALILLDF